MIKEDKKQLALIALIIFLVMLGIAYAYLNANLNVTGTSNVARTTWNIHFENLHDNTNMTLGQNDSAASITQNKTNEVTYAISFNEPGQFYEFTVDAKNDGTIDGMINAVTSTIKIGNGEATPITSSPSNLPAYMSYTATYSDGTPIEQDHLLAANQKETYKVRIEFKTDIEASDLPGTDQTVELTFGVEYIQKDSNAINRNVVYTANKWDKQISSLNDETNTTLVWIGQTIPNGITTYRTPTLAMEALKQISGNVERPFFLKHTLLNNRINESYVGFVITEDMVTQTEEQYMTNCNNDQECIDGYNGLTAGNYYLKGKKTFERTGSSWHCMSEYSDGNGNCTDPYYNTNKATLLSAFGSSNCTGNTNFRCEAVGLYSYADVLGNVKSEDGRWKCEVHSYGYSGCYE